MKILIYKLTHDSGFAPNPFWGYLTLAACMPNHLGVKKGTYEKYMENEGLYLVGVESKMLAQKRISKNFKPEVKQSLIYFAKVTEILTLNEYFNDHRFKDKKFEKNSRDWRKRRGDNVYYIENGKWKWLRCHGHEPKTIRELPDEEVFFDVTLLDKYLKDTDMQKKYDVILKDLKGNKVFISEEFVYFGDKGIEFPLKFAECLPNRYKYCPDKYTKDFVNFINKLIEKYGDGLQGNPINCHIDDNCNDSAEEKSPCNG
ncbi:conserved hypothetical protein [Deferribacter desulfuricans SSM1]|uniref:Nucleotide modification associated domain-containing protein n=1 Tax=Deferribacter desulfuricans (strain DSM 14783 / JCM 11476 / NBRC 101012 / SSM1) TaxID=639282 RepID=D3PCN7_DEFDS|nr:hypothetical protein [Deferribacter desulfuricans]BAI80360.1 conserved hypothetical protein [Deferribacter desulfuricans SSM1]